MTEQFDLRVHIRNAKGRLVRKQPYRLVIEKGAQLFERPVDSGYWYNAAGELVKQPEKKADGHAKK